jgi:hypothetical protein
MRKALTLWLDQEVIEAIEKTRGNMLFDQRANYLLRLGLLAGEQERNAAEGIQRIILEQRQRSKGRPP